MTYLMQAEGSLRALVRRTARVALLTGLVASAMTLAEVAHAEEATETFATETVDALAVAGNLVESAAPVEESSIGYEASVSGSDVSLPRDSGDPLVLAIADSEVAVALPEFVSDEGVLDDSGAVVYEAASAPVSMAAQATADGGMQILVVINEESAPLDYEFAVSPPIGGFLAMEDDGSVNVVGADGITVARVEPAWARDANGNAVPTWFEVNGDKLIQHVEHAGSAYPVVADPNIGNCGWNSCTIYWTTTETRRIADGTIGVTAAAAACGLAGGPYAAATCVALGAYLVLSAQNARAQNKCLKIKVYYAILPAQTGSYTKGTCST